MSEALLKVFVIGVIIYCALYVITQPVVAWMKWDNEHGTPRVYFHSQYAWDHCGQMRDEAAKHGATHWTCKRPQIHDYAD